MLYHWAEEAALALDSCLKDTGDGENVDRDSLVGPKLVRDVREKAVGWSSGKWWGISKIKAK